MFFEPPDGHLRLQAFPKAVSSPTVISPSWSTSIVRHKRPLAWLQKGDVQRTTDAREPERTRWMAQFEMQNAASFQELKYFTDMRARNGTRHPFSCAPDRLNDFIANIEPLIDAGRVRVEVAGVRGRSRSQRGRRIAAREVRRR